MFKVWKCTLWNAKWGSRMASILNLPDVTRWLPLRVEAMVLRPCCFVKRRGCPQSWQGDPWQGSVAGPGRTTSPSWIWTPLLSRSFWDLHIPSHSDCGPLFEALCQTLVILGEEKPCLVPILGERQACNRFWDACYHGKNRIKPGVYRNIFQRSCELN